MTSVTNAVCNYITWVTSDICYILLYCILKDITSVIYHVLDHVYHLQRLSSTTSFTYHFWQLLRLLPVTLFSSPMTYQISCMSPNVCHLSRLLNNMFVHYPIYHLSSLSSITCGTFTYVYCLSPITSVTFTYVAFNNVCHQSRLSLLHMIIK